MSGQSGDSNSGAENNDSSATTNTSGVVPTQSIRDTLPVGARIGPYEVHAVLGAGGFGKVYLSRDPDLDKEIAIKEFFPESHARRINEAVEPLTNSEDSFENGKRQFLREAQTIAGYKHHSIVEIFGILDANNTHYMVMEYLGGKTLTLFCAERGGALDWDSATRILTPLLDALSIVHASGKIHRDISPDNVMIRPDGSPVLLDFGNVRDALLEDDLAKRSRQLSKSTAIINDGFSPFELYSANRADLKPATDIYSLAAVFYLALTGIRPASSTARAEDAIENGRELRSDGPLKPFSAVTLNGSFPINFLSSLEAGLSLRQIDRPQSILEWREQLFSDSEQKEKTDSSKQIRNLSIAASVVAIATGLGFWITLSPKAPSPGGIIPQENGQPQTPAADAGEFTRIVNSTRRIIREAQSTLVSAIELAKDEVAIEGDVTEAKAVLAELEQIESNLQSAVESKDLDELRSANVAATKAQNSANELAKNIEVAVNDVSQSREIAKAKLDAVVNRVVAAANEAIAIAGKAKVAAESVEGVEDEVAKTNEAEAAAREAIASANTALKSLDVAVAEEARKKAEAALDNAQIALNQINRKTASSRESALEQIGRIEAEVLKIEASAEEIATRIRQALSDTDPRLAKVDAALNEIQNVKNRLSSAREGADVTVATKSLEGAKAQLAVLNNTESEVITEQQGQEIAAAAALKRAIENVNSTLSDLEEAISNAVQNAQSLVGVETELGELSRARAQINKLKAVLSEASEIKDIDRVENIQLEADTLKNQVIETVVSLENKKKISRDRIEQAVAVVGKIVVESQETISSIEQQAGSNPEVSTSIERAKASFEVIKASQKELEVAAEQGDLTSAEVAVERSRSAKSEFDVAIANVRTRLDGSAAQARRDADAAAQAVSEIEALQKEAQNEASQISGAEPALEKIEQALVQARDAAQQAANSVDSASANEASAARVVAEEKLEDARLALQEIRDAVAAAAAAKTSRITIAQLNGEQRTGLYRGLFELSFLEDQEISEEFLISGAPDPLIQEAVLAYNRESNNPGGTDLSTQQLQEIVSAAKGATPWEIERTIPILRSVSERSLWDYGINRQLGQRPFTIIPQISQGVLKKNRPLISEFQRENGQNPSGFFANHRQLIEFLDRPISVSVTPTQGEASANWYYSETDKDCAIWTYARQIQGVYLRPDLPLIVIKKNKQEETPDINVSFGPSNAFVSNSVSLTSNGGASTQLTTNSTGLGMHQNDGLADKTAISALKNDRTISVSGSSIFGTPLTIQYSAQGFQKAFSKIERNCTLEVGFWTE